MKAKSTKYGRLCQPHSVDTLLYLIRMRENDTKTVLWENLERLMIKHYGKVNVSRLGADTGVGGTTSRLKAQSTSVGIEVLEKLAAFFKVSPWQLLVPDLDVNSPQVIQTHAEGIPMPLVDRERYVALPAPARDLIQGYVSRLIDEQEAKIRGTASGKLSPSKAGDNHPKTGAA